MVLVLQRITLSMDDRSGFKRLFWKSLGEPSPASEEKEDELKQASKDYDTEKVWMKINLVE